MTKENNPFSHSVVANASLLLQPAERLKQKFERKISLVQDLYTLVSPAFSVVFYTYLNIFSQVYEAFVGGEVNCQRHD